MPRKHEKFLPSIYHIFPVLFASKRPHIDHIDVSSIFKGIWWDKMIQFYKVDELPLNLYNSLIFDESLNILELYLNDMKFQWGIAPFSESYKELGNI